MSRRTPHIEVTAQEAADRLSKSDWIEIARDLAIRCIGEEEHQREPLLWLRTCEETHRILRDNRKGGES